MSNLPGIPPELKAKPIPCRRCINAMAVWKSNRPKPVCLDTPTASTKCLDCKENNKPCITPTGSLRTRGLELARILDTSSVSTNAVKTAQNAVKTILKNDKNRRQATREANANGGANARNAAAAASAVSSSNTKADADAEYDEYDERRTAALERIADSLERLVAYAAAVPAISETLNIVHRNALEQAEKEADEGSH